MRRSMVIAALAAAPALGQSNVSAVNKYCWGENVGFMNWRDAGWPAASQGVVSHGTYLSGFAWAENVGYVNLGSAPAAGTAYGNATGQDAGVNILGNGDLGGMAWGENIGWINFATGTLGAQRARVESGRLRGFAWGENIGWINLDDAGVYVSFGGACYANCDNSTVAPILNVQDFSCFLNKFANSDPYANCDGSTVAPVLNVQDFSCFLNKFAVGCS